MYEKANASDASLIVRPEDFFDTRHGTIFETILQIITDGGVADPTFVLDRLQRDKQINLVGGPVYIASLYEKACVAPSVPHYARLIARASTYRRVRLAGQRIFQAASENQMDEADLIQWSTEQISAARDERTGVDQLTLEYQAFLDHHTGVREMLIPGIFGKSERLILTGHGGLGKTTYCQQIVTCAAGGIQPFDWASGEVYEPLRVSIFDCENRPYRLKNRLTPIVEEVAKRGQDPRPNLNIMKDSGQRLNLMDPQTALSILRTIEHDKPDIVYIGPLYKLHHLNADKEEATSRIADFLDSICNMGAGVVAEAHINKEAGVGGSLAPSGSNLWTWWPEYGHGLRLSSESDAAFFRRCNVERWRGDREENNWPTQIETSGVLGLPWHRTIGG